MTISLIEIVIYYVFPVGGLLQDSLVLCLLCYCPQYDALIDQLTGRETLVLAVRLRGVRDVKACVSRLLKDLQLVAAQLLTDIAGQGLQVNDASVVTSPLFATNKLCQVC